MPKVKRSKGGGGETSEGAVALADQILQADALRVRGRVKIRDSRTEDEDKYVDERLSRKILQQARIQQEELQTEYGLAPEKKKTPVTVLGNVPVNINCVHSIENVFSFVLHQMHEIDSYVNRVWCV